MNVILLQSFDLIDGQKAIINTPKTVQHIKTVLNPKIGDTLKVGQLGGLLGRAKVASIGDGVVADSVVLDELCLDTPAPKKLPITVVLALPRPKVLRRLIMDMTAIGVSHIVLINSYRTDKSYWQSPLLARLDEFVLEGLSQGVDTIAPKLTLAKRFRSFVEDELAHLGKPMAVFHPYGEQTMGDYLRATTPKTIVIGAEGGLIDFEIELLKSQGANVITLGERILRTEAAVNVVLGRLFLG